MSWKDFPTRINRHTHTQPVHLDPDDTMQQAQSFCCVTSSTSDDACLPLPFSVDNFVLIVSILPCMPSLFFHCFSAANQPWWQTWTEAKEIPAFFLNTLALIMSSQLQTSQMWMQPRLPTTEWNCSCCSWNSPLLQLLFLVNHWDHVCHIVQWCSGHWALQSLTHKDHALCCQMLICKTQSHHRLLFGTKTHPNCCTFCCKKCIVANLSCSCFLVFFLLVVSLEKWFRCSNLSTPKAHLFPLFPPFWGPPLQKWPKGQCNLTCGPWPLALLHSTDIPHCMWTWHFFSNCGVPHQTSSPCRTAVTTGFSLGKHGSFAGGAAQVLRIRILPLKRTVNDLSGVDKIEYWNGLSNVFASFAP